MLVILVTNLEIGKFLTITSLANYLASSEK